jgi:peptidoglycan/LPS O-acetylase OafA/YrhL
MWSLERHPDTLGFYIRRAFRIYPLAVAVIALILLFRLPLTLDLVNYFAQPARDLKTVIANALMIQNLVHRPYMESVMWTLPLEVQMYVALPMLAAFARKERTLWTAIVLWVLAAAIVEAMFPRIQEFNIITVVPCFLPGVIAYIGYMKREPFLPAWTLAPFLLGLSATMLCRSSKPIGWLMCLLLGLALPYFKQPGNRIVIRIGHTVAKYSYSIYLIHVGCLAIGFHYLHLGTALGMAVSLTSLVILAPLFYHGVEHPMIRLGHRIADRRDRLPPSDPAIA